MKRLIPILLCLLLVTALAIPAAAAGSVRFSISPSSTTVQRGDTITFTVSVSGSEPCTQYGLMLSYDTSVYELVSGSCTASGALFSNFNNGFAVMFQSATVPSGTVGTFTLRVKDTASFGRSTVSGSASAKNGSDTVSSSGCSASVTIACNHDYGSWSNADNTSHQKICTVCGDVRTENHTWNSGTVTKAATCKEEGTKAYTCTTCNSTKTEAVAKTDSHSYGSWTQVNDSTHKHTCSVCSKEETANHAWNSGTITKQPSCKETGVKTYTCTGCDASKTEDIAKTTTHSYGSWSKVDDNTHKHTCSVCANAETANHTWNAGSVTKAATCKEAGEKTYTCTACSATRTEAIAKTTVHSFGAWTQVNDSTHKRTCSVCDFAETANHTWNTGAVTKNATCKETGVKTYTCTACGAVKTEDIAKLTTHAYNHACDTDCNVCGLTRTTNHSYKTTLSKDKSAHWYECDVCGDRKDSASHTPGAAATENSAQTCTICGYVITPALGHKHSYAAQWTTDLYGHWYTCSGCEEKGDYADHDFQNACDTDCPVCGYVREIVHAYGDGWNYNDAGHWYECSVCGEKKDAADHVPGAEATETTAQVCTTCGYEIAPALGSSTKETAPTTPAENTQPSENAPSVDGEETPGSSFPWWIIILAACVLATIGIVALRVRKKQ